MTPKDIEIELLWSSNGTPMVTYHVRTGPGLVGQRHTTALPHFLGRDATTSDKYERDVKLFLCGRLA